MSQTSTVEYATGEFSLAKLSFRVIPSRVKNILTIVIPISMLIFINGLGLWFSVKTQFFHRISLGITSLLADFALTFSLQIPSSGAYTWINMYILLSYLYIAFTLLSAYIEVRGLGRRLFPKKTAFGYGRRSGAPDGAVP